MLARAEKAAVEVAVEENPQPAEAVESEELLLDGSSLPPGFKTSAPSRIINSVFRDLAVEIRSKAGKLGFEADGKKRLVSRSMVEDMVGEGVISAQLGKQILDLRELRNIAVMEPFSADGEDVLRYMGLVDRVKRSLKESQT